MSSSDHAFLLSWLDSVLASKSAKTRQSYAYVAARLYAFLERRSYPTELHLLRPFHIREFFAAVRAEGVSPNTLANFDRTLRAIFNRIEREGREDFDLGPKWKNPLTVVERERPRKISKEPLSPAEARHLLQALPRTGFIAYRNYAEIAFMLMSGARCIEVRHLRVGDVNLEQRLANLEVTKGNKPRVVFLPVRLCRILASYLRRRERRIGDASDLLFPTRTAGMQSARALHRTVERAGARANIPKLGPHRLRHSYVTLSHAKGAPLKFLQEQCGHSSVLVTQGYITLSHEQKSELADRFAAY